MAPKPKTIAVKNGNDSTVCFTPALCADAVLLPDAPAPAPVPEPVPVLVPVLVP